MRKCAIRVLLSPFVALILFFPAPPASAAPVEITRMVCEDESDPSTCTLQVVRVDNPTPTEAGNGAGGGTGPDRLMSYCDWKVLAPQPPPIDTRWEGADPLTNVMYFRICGQLDGFLVVPLSEPVPPPDPSVVAQMAMSQLTVADPTLHFGPDPVQAVNRWTYLWVDNPGPLTATAELRGVSVTATAELTSVEWSMGEPMDARKSASGPVPSFTCAGAGRDPGTAANSRIDAPQAPNSCAYVFQWRSLPERTGGTGAWNVTAFSTWTVTWTSNVGAGGTDQLFGQSTNPVSVGEWRSELVVGPG